MLVLILGFLGVIIGLTIKPFKLKNIRLLYIILGIQFGYRFIECITHIGFILIAIQVVLLVLLLIFIWENRRQFSIVITGIGFILNLIVMILNNGKMPVLFEYGVNDIRHMMINETTRACILSDILSLPYPLNIGMIRFSIGDLIIWTGLMIIVIELTHYNKKGLNFKNIKNNK